MVRIIKAQVVAILATLGVHKDGMKQADALREEHCHVRQVQVAQGLVDPCLPLPQLEFADLLWVCAAVLSRLFLRSTRWLEMYKSFLDTYEGKVRLVVRLCTHAPSRVGQIPKCLRFQQADLALHVKINSNTQCNN